MCLLLPLASSSPISGQAPFSGQAPSPVGGVPAPIPGVLEAEAFDDGGPGVSFVDTTPGNAGGAFRSTDVDIERTEDAGGGYDVAWLRSGEWLEYTVEVAEATFYDVTARVASHGPGATFHLELDGIDYAGAFDIPDTGGWQRWTTVTRRGVFLPAGMYRLRLRVAAVSPAGTSGGINAFTFVRSRSRGAPGGAPAPVPGTLEAEEFDLGGDGVGAHDTTPGNAGGTYREGDVDIMPVAEASGGHAVAWMRPGEWLAYTVAVASSGVYQVEARVASLGAGAVLRVDADGRVQTAPFTVPDTGGWQQWAWSAPQQMTLVAGVRVLRVTVVAAGPAGTSGGLDRLRITKVKASTPFGEKPIPVPGRIEAEAFDRGGPGIAYADDTMENLGHAFRAEAVDIEPTTDAGGGMEVAWIRPGEWMRYSVNVTAEGPYVLRWRAAGLYPGLRWHLEVDGHDATGPLGVPATGGWQRWQDVRRPDVWLPKGRHVLRLVADAVGPSGTSGALNHLQLDAQPLQARVVEPFNALDPGVWTAVTSGVTANGRLRMTGLALAPRHARRTGIDLTGGVLTVLAVVSPGTRAQLAMRPDDKVAYAVSVHGGSLLVTTERHGVAEPLTLPVPYTPADMARWRMRHDALAGLLLFETAPASGGNWTARAAVPAPPDLSSVVVELGAAQGGTTAPDARVEFDDLRVEAPPRTCALDVPATVAVAAGARTAEVAVSADPGCAWAVHDAPSWFSPRLHAGGIHVGVGSASVAFDVAENPTAELRIGTVRIGPHRIEVGQAGAPAPMCTAAVSPLVVEVGPSGGVASLTVQAAAGCTWTAASQNSFIGIATGAVGAGSDVVRLTVAHNDADAPRAGVVRVAGHAVSVLQAAAISSDGSEGPSPPASPPDDPCVPVLSVHSVALPTEGGVARVSIAVGGGCAWTATSHAPWLVGMGTLQGSGPGEVAFAAASNRGSLRAGTLTVAGETVTVTQAASQSGDGVGADIRWDHTWPDESRVDNCYGNCGGGCSGSPNPCGGGSGTWTHAVLTSLSYAGDDWLPVCSDAGGWWEVYPRYTAMARWTYHGQSSDGCRLHDGLCRSAVGTAGPLGWFVGCFLSSVLPGSAYCSGARSATWSYDYLAVAHASRPVAYVDAEDLTCE
ncbi:MAG: carbohydrate-binding protein [Vicinamibacterales bacterium]